MANSVNFQIENSHKEQKIVHHDRLLPVVNNGLRNETIPYTPSDADVQSSAGDFSEDSDYSHSDSDSVADDEHEDGKLNRERPKRQRQQQNIPNSIPWDAIRI